MKVILLRDVARIGKKGTVVEVPDGYAMNQLIPTRSAEAATPQNLKKAERAMGQKMAKAEADEKAFTEIIAQIDALNGITVAVEANEKGHLFKAISPKDVAAALQAEGVATDLLLISFKEPVKEVGDHQAVLTHAGLTHTIAFTVTAV